MMNGTRSSAASAPLLDAGEDVPDAWRKRKSGIQEAWTTSDRAAYAALFAILAYLAVAAAWGVFPFSQPVPVLPETVECPSSCTSTLLETIPLQVDLVSAVPSIYDAWSELLMDAEHSIDIGTFYMNLWGTSGTVAQGVRAGRDIYRLIQARARDGVKVRLAIQTPLPFYPPDESDGLVEAGVERRFIDLRPLGGVAHWKVMIFDKKHVYIGSANHSWLSLTHVKEIGLMIKDCACVAHDMGKVFEALWNYEQANWPPARPDDWPAHLLTTFNVTHPRDLIINGHRSNFALTASPPSVVSPGRSYDLDAIVEVIGSAKTWLGIEVMDYAPVFALSEPKLWFPPIDDALRAAAMRGVNVHLLMSSWNHTDPTYFDHLQSLQVAHPDQIQVRLMHLPSWEPGPDPAFSRVNHAKFLVTDNLNWLGTSNWSGDYFARTAGMAYVTSDYEIQQGLQTVFFRDWNSTYTRALPTWHRNCTQYVPPSQCAISLS